MKSISMGLLFVLILCTSGCVHDDISSPANDIRSATAVVHPLGKSDAGHGQKILYSENFSKSARGWLKVDGPGLLEVGEGVFKHTTPGYSVWCEYAYGPMTFGNATYVLDVFVESQTLATSFVWRAPNLQTVTADGGAYLATFNNSGLAPGPAGHFTVEKLDQHGRTILLDIADQFLGLNRLVIEDGGTSITVSVNGVSYGPLGVTNLSPPQSGYIFLIGGDRGAGDYFDNIKIRRF